MKEPILVMMAAGMGSRYGGLKQLDPVGPDGEVILDYSLYDAYQAGFRRVVFLIKHEIEDAFKAMVGSRVPAGMEANYAFQQLDKLPEGFSVPEGRVKPWGTGHAVCAAANSSMRRSSSSTRTITTARARSSWRMSTCGRCGASAASTSWLATR